MQKHKNICELAVKNRPTVKSTRLLNIKPFTPPSSSSVHLFPCNYTHFFSISPQSQAKIKKSDHSFLKFSSEMGLSINSPDCNNIAKSHHHTHKIFLLSNYILLGAASSCIFLILSLRLVPSVSGLLLILLHVLTISGAISGCSAASGGSNKLYALHMVATVLTAIFQGSVSVLIFTTTSNFLGALKSYVREDDAALILKLAGGLSISIFCLEWVVLVLAFVQRYYGFVEGNNGGSRVQDAAGERGKWASFQPFQV